MSGQAGLGCDHRVIANAGAACDADLGDNDAVTANLNIMSNLNLIVDFRALFDQGAAEAGTIDCGVSSNFYIVINLNIPYLINLSVASVYEFITTRSPSTVSW